MDSEELARLKESIRNQGSTASQHAREAKLMESRALQLAGELDRVKDMLQVGTTWPTAMCLLTTSSGGSVSSRLPCAPAITGELWSPRFVRTSAPWLAGGTKHDRVHEAHPKLHGAAWSEGRWQQG